MSLKWRHGLPSRRTLRGLAILHLLIACVAVTLIVLIIGDANWIRWTSIDLQVSASAGAVSGAIALTEQPDIDFRKVRARALDLALSDDVIYEATYASIDPTRDIEIGLYDLTTKSFTPMSGRDDTPVANAVRITAYRSIERGNRLPVRFPWLFGRWGAHISGSALAVVSGGPRSFGFVGLEQVQVGGTARVAGSIASNGRIDVSDSAEIEGEARPGRGHRVFRSAGARVTRWTAPLDMRLSDAPDRIPAQNENDLISNLLKPDGALVLTSGSATIPAGRFVLKGLNIAPGATLSVQAGAQLYIDGALRLEGAIDNPGAPADCYIALVGPHSTGTIAGGARLTTHLYAPQSQVSFAGNCSFDGWVFAGRLTISGAAKLRYDGTLPHDRDLYSATIIR